MWNLAVAVPLVLLGFRFGWRRVMSIVLLLDLVGWTAAWWAPGVLIAAHRTADSPIRFCLWAVGVLMTIVLLGQFQVSLLRPWLTAFGTRRALAGLALAALLQASPMILFFQVVFNLLTRMRSTPIWVYCSLVVGATAFISLHYVLWCEMSAYCDRPVSEQICYRGSSSRLTPVSALSPLREANSKGTSGWGDRWICYGTVVSCGVWGMSLFLDAPTSNFDRHSDALSTWLLASVTAGALGAACALVIEHRLLSRRERVAS